MPTANKTTTVLPMTRMKDVATSKTGLSMSAHLSSLFSTLRMLTPFTSFLIHLPASSADALIFKYFAHPDTGTVLYFCF